MAAVCCYSSVMPEVTHHADSSLEDLLGELFFAGKSNAAPVLIELSHSLSLVCMTSGVPVRKILHL